MSDSDYPIEKYRECRLTLLHLYIYVLPLSSQEKKAIEHVIDVLDRIAPPP